MASAVPSPSRRQVRRVALVSLAVALALAGLKLAAALASGSLALLSEAAHSGLDAVVTAMTLLAVSIAARPPDEDHPYGHGKAENVAALVEAIVLLALSVSIAAEALHRLSRPAGDVEAGWYGFGVILLSMAVDASRARALRKAGRELRSPALTADALNFTADLLTSAVVLAGLGAVRLGYPRADSLGGLVISGYVALVSLRLGWRSIDVLMDRVPRGALARITQAAAAVAGVEEVRRVRLRYAGGQPQADVVLAVSRTVPLELAHHLTEEVEDAIRSVEPGADVAVHVEPLADEKLIVNRILSIAARHSQVHQLHNVFVTQRPDGLHISLHAKFPASMALSEAHAITDRLEAEIARDLDGVRRIDTHL
ncbi:MAG: cation-efflux pump, partial [Actinomycetota bacterium]